MQLEEIYGNVIEKTMDRLNRDAVSLKVRRDVLEAIRRKWVASLDDGKSVKPVSNLDSDPRVADRSKYARTNPDTVSLVVDEPVAVADIDDDFADEFSDGDVVHATEAGRKLAETPALAVTVSVSTARVPTSRPSERSKPQAELVNVEELPETLDDPEYDKIPEPSDCDIRIFGQTEVCESVEGPRRVDSRWMVTVLNGFVQIGSTGQEIVFRTASQTMSHIHQ